MIEDIKLNISALEIEKNDIIRLYKKQLEDYRQIKKLVERAAWDDEKYYALIENLNIVGKSLAKALHALTDGDNIYIIDDLVFWTQKYLENKDKFPQI